MSTSVETAQSNVAVEFRALIDNSDTTYQDLRDFLGKLTPEQKRLAITKAGGKKRQARLWDLAEAGPTIKMENLIPKDAEPLEPVIFYGKNSLLPPFTGFQKRMCRAPDGDALWGYNHQLFGFATGPGYFVVRDGESEEIGPVAIDYTAIPPEKPGSWPTIRSNRYKLSWFIYHNMVDCLREVGEGVFIGRAVRRGKITSNYFLLARDR